MEKTLQTRATLVLAAFVAVFVFGCTASAVDAPMIEDGHGMTATHQQTSHDRAGDHMGVSLDLPASGQLALLLGILLLAIGLRAVILRLESRIRESATRVRWRLRSRRETWTSYTLLPSLFRTGLLNPKIY